MKCRECREIADSYLSDELPSDTHRQVLEHLEDCAECRGEFAARRELRAKLRAAFARAENLQIRPEFAERLRLELPGAARPLVTRRGRWLALAACLVIAVGSGWWAVREWRRAGAPPAARTTQPGLSSPPVEAHRSALLALAIGAAGVHANCAIAHKVEEAPIDLQEAGRRYDRAYLDLMRAVMARQGGEAGAVRLIGAHSCVFGGRRYGHVILEHRNRIVSVLVTDLGQAGGAAAGPAPNRPDPAPQVISCAPAERYQISCFQTARHAVFIISDLAETENLAVARRLAPSISDHIIRAEG